MKKTLSLLLALAASLAMAQNANAQLKVGDDAPATSLRIDVALSGALTIVAPANQRRASSAPASVALPMLVGAFERFLRDAGWIDAR